MDIDFDRSSSQVFHIGAASVAKASPDGHTLLVMEPSVVLAKWLHKNVAFDALADFTAIALVATTPLVLFAHPSLPASNTAELIAYSKAIELDRWFAWPYSNLAITYAQKGRFAEAILLYQRSIELFATDKDKAISWNRLGNVYRRMNDYDNAICAYQRADELDPDNTTLSLQSRFSLLGSYAFEQKPSYIA